MRRKKNWALQTGTTNARCEISKFISSLICESANYILTKGAIFARREIVLNKNNKIVKYIKTKSMRIF